MTNREFIFTELVTIGHEQEYGPIPLGTEEHAVNLFDLINGVSKATNERCYNPIKHFEKGLRVFERYGVLKVLKIEDALFPSYRIAYVNDPDKWQKFFDDVPAKHRKKIEGRLKA